MSFLHIQNIGFKRSKNRPIPMMLMPMIVNPTAGSFVKHAMMPEIRPPIPPTTKENTIANKAIITDQMEMYTARIMMSRNMPIMNQKGKPQIASIIQSVLFLDVL